MKIYILVGLPASGKTYYGLKLSDKLKCTFVDDISLNHRVNSLEYAIRHKEDNIVVSDINLCRSNEREKCKSWLERNAKEYEVEFIFFENNPNACLANSKRRMLNGDDRKVDGAIQQLSEVYKIPDNVKSIPCYELIAFNGIGYENKPTYLIGDKNGCTKPKL